MLTRAMYVEQSVLSIANAIIVNRGGIKLIRPILFLTLLKIKALSTNHTVVTLLIARLRSPLYSQQSAESVSYRGFRVTTSNFTVQMWGVTSESSVRYTLITLQLVSQSREVYERFLSVIKRILKCYRILNIIKFAAHSYTKN